MASAYSIGIIGGSGQLGSAIARSLLRTRFIDPEKLWISSRSRSTSTFDEGLEVQVTIRNQELVDACQIVLLSVPPHLFSTIDVDAEDRLVISVMAGVSLDQIEQQTRAKRIVRAMSNPAAEIGLAYSPWCGSACLTDEDRDVTRRLFEACGLTDEVDDETQIGRFTAITGPVPGFVAYFADCMVQYAVKNGVHPIIAERAVRQLFLASGTVMAESLKSPGDHIQEMVTYAGTTAAGLNTMQNSPLAASIEQGLEAAFQKTLDMS